jgi:hypothetical protein
MILAGTSTYGTEAAARFVCWPPGVRELLSRLRLDSTFTPPPFEALIEVVVRGGTPLEPHLLIVHRRRIERRQ